MKFFILLLFYLSLMHADEIRIIELAHTLNLSAGSKAIVQWERVFTSERKMKRYGIHQLSSKDKDALKEYLIKHAIDSDQPTIAGV